MAGAVWETDNLRFEGWAISWSIDIAFRTKVPCSVEVVADEGVRLGVGVRQMALGCRHKREVQAQV